jgi:hypothetical protein
MEGIGRISVSKQDIETLQIVEDSIFKDTTKLLSSQNL